MRMYFIVSDQLAQTQHRAVDTYQKDRVYRDKEQTPDRIRFLSYLSVDDRLPDKVFSPGFSLPHV